MRRDRRRADQSCEDRTAELAALVADMPAVDGRDGVVLRWGRQVEKMLACPHDPICDMRLRLDLDFYSPRLSGDADGGVCSRHRKLRDGHIDGDVVELHR